MLKKNLEYINNTDLKNRLESLKIEETRIDMSYCMTNSNDYLLMKNDVPIDDIDNPRAAVQKMLSESIKNNMRDNDIIITFGIGMCYQLDEVYNKYPSKIYVYEPDTKLLHFVLSNVDISEHLKSGRVFIFDQLDDLISKLSSDYITKDRVEIVYLKNYAVVKSQELLELTQKIYETCRSKTVDINTITRYSRIWLQNSIQNISDINKKDIYCLSDLEGKFIGETALVVGAGPSLSENIQYIKDNREKFVIFAVNKALNYLSQNNILPDFVVCTDARFVEKTLAGLEEVIPKVNCIMHLNSDSSVLNKDFKKIFIAFTNNDGIVKRLAEYNSFIKPQDCGGSATTAAFVSASLLGFSKVILTGVDLAFKGNVIYSTGETFEKISQDEIKINSITKSITTVKSVTGLDVVTSADYAAFIQHYETLIKELNYTEVYNTTSFGANINGAKNMPLDQILIRSISNTTAIKLGEVRPFKMELTKWAQDELALINNIITILSQGSFSQALIAAIVKSQLMYQYMQSDILNVVQQGFREELAEDFISKTKEGIKYIIDALQSNKLI